MSRSGWTRLVIGALTLLVAATPSAAFAAQETKWDATAQKQLKSSCGPKAKAGCGSMTAVLDVRAEKGGFGSWGRQRTIELSPFRTGGRFTSDRNQAPVASVCTDLSITLLSQSPNVSSAPFGDIPLSLDTSKILGAGTNAVHLNGNKCQPYNYVQSGAVAFRPANAFLDSGRSKITKVVMKVRTRIYMSPNYFVKTAWASDTIEF
jgi:hypothetical protein